MSENNNHPVPGSTGTEPNRDSIIPGMTRTIRPDPQSNGQDTGEWASTNIRPDTFPTTVFMEAKEQEEASVGTPGMRPDHKSRDRKEGKRRRRLWATIPVLVLILALVGWQVVPRILAKPAATVQSQRLAQVTRGNLTVAVTGSGPLAPVSKRTVSAEVNSTLLEILKKNGDTVKAGELLAKLDASDAETALSSAESNLQDELASADTTSTEISSLMVRAPFDGLVSDLSVKEGDTVAKNGTLLTLTDVDHLIATVPFGISDRASLKEGQTATLSFSSLAGTVTGQVSHVGENGYRSTDGGEAVDVEITVDNPGALASGMTATVEVQTASGAMSALSDVSLEYANVKVLRSDAGGDVQSVAIRDNQRVKSGSLLLVMENTDLSKTARTAQTRIANLTKNVENAQADVDSCVVRAPMDGIVTGLDATVGDSVKAGAALCSILDTTSMTMEIAIDELDIASISPGQSVTATVDAVTDTETTPLTGTVSNIAVEGSSSNGVTTYPVTLTLNPDSRLKSGMNADASILVTNKENVLLVPIEAVTTVNGRSFVYVSGTPSVASTGGAIGMGGQMPEGFDPANMPEGFDPAQMPGGGFPGDAAVSGAGIGAGNSAGQRQRGNRTRPGSTSGGAIGSGTSASGGFQRNGSGTTASGSAASGSGKWNGGGTSGSTAASGSSSGSETTGTRRSGTGSSNDYYAGATLVRVEIGAHNETYMEITSGLSETDQVVLPALTTSSGSSTTTQQSGFSIPGMGGAMGGGFGGQTGGTRSTGTSSSSGTRSSGNTSGTTQGGGDFGPPPN